MAFVKPQINTIKPDIAKLSIYLRSTKKFGKTTLFRDVILEKYGDPSYGLLVGCGAEIGYEVLDNLNKTHVNSWSDVKEMVDWLIAEKGKEHNIKMVAFDTGDELVELADRAVVAMHNRENPQKKVRSIKAALGGYTAGEKYSANQLIKPMISLLRQEGFGVWVIAHSKLKTIKDKGGLEEDGYQQLTSNLSADYEAAFGDCMDLCLTGVVDRALEDKDGKKIATDSVRKLYFRGTPMIDAGSRFASGAVPEYLVFDKDNMAKEFIKTCEEGMEKSKLSGFIAKPTAAAKEVVETKPVNVVSEDVPINVDADEPSLLSADEAPAIVDEELVTSTDSIADRLTSIRTAFATASKETKKAIREILLQNTETGKLDESLPESVLVTIENLLK